VSKNQFCERSALLKNLATLLGYCSRDTRQVVPGRAGFRVRGDAH